MDVRVSKCFIERFKMKKIILIFAFLLLLTACGTSADFSSESSETAECIDGNNQTDIKQTNVLGVTEKYNTDFESCKNTAYINLDWTNAVNYPVNSVSEIYDLQYDGDIHIIETIPQKDRLEQFKEYCIFYFGEYLDECAFFESYDTIPNVTKTETPANGITYRSYYRVSDFQNELENNKVRISWLIYRNIEKKQYLWWAQTEYPHWINKGEAMTALAQNFNYTSWIPSDLGEPIARYYNDGKSDSVTYKLSDGEISIGDAIRYFTEDYARSLPYEDKPEYYVRYVDVYKMDNETYAYVLITTTMFNGIPYEQDYEISSSSVIPDHFASYGQALMIMMNDIDTALWCCPETEMKPVGNPVEKIVSLKAAADIVSHNLSQSVKFNVISTELIYHGRSALLKPTWLFTLYNTNDSLYYNAYVDAETGKFSYFAYSFA